MFRNYTGSLGVRFWDGETMTLGNGCPAATIVFHSPRAFRDLVMRRDLVQLAEAHFLGDIDVEGDLHALLAQRDHLPSLTLSIRDRLSLFLAALFTKSNAARTRDPDPLARSLTRLRSFMTGKHSRTRDRDVIAFHYDVSNDFYRLWLDDQMVYSCAYFNDPSQSIDHAQRNKLDHICRKLRLKDNERLLDIGCGWGALICWAAQKYDVHAHGITLSHRQFEFTQSKIRNLGLQEKVTVELRDYRDLPKSPVFDKVSSVGMFEHVGLKNLPAYFQTVRRVLKPGGLFLNHGITSDEEGWRTSIGTEFIQRYIFPDAELDTVSNVQRVMERTGFEVWDVEALRAHYALTLRHWVNRLETRRKEALTHVSEATYRVWRLYMAACAAHFERGSVGVYQILATNGREGLTDVPLTRHDLYR